jgi:hypothetical protein
LGKLGAVGISKIESMLEKIFVFCNNLFLSFASLARVVLQSKWNFARLGKVGDGSIIILGNGPSFKETEQKYSSILANNTLMAVNSFCETDYYTQLKPKYYIVNANNFFFRENDIPQIVIDLRNKVFSDLYEKTSWPCVLFVPYTAKKYKPFRELMARNPNIRVSYYNNTAVEGLKAFCFPMYNVGLGMPRPHNVIIPAIMNAIGMGIKKIVLVGADHSWLPEISVTDDNVALLNQKHFYDEDAARSQTMVHSVKRVRRLHEMLHKFYLSFRGYWDILAYAQYKNVTIFNSSEHSFIDAFERKKLDKIFH